MKEYRYKILEADSVEQLEQIVNESMQKGFKPKGGVEAMKIRNYYAECYEYRYFQAVVKDQ